MTDEEKKEKKLEYAALARARRNHNILANIYRRSAPRNSGRDNVR